MRLACPTCATAYEIPDHVLGTGRRTLRCARCGTEWTFPALPAAPASNPTKAEAAPPLPRFPEPCEPDTPRAPSSALAEVAPALAISGPSIAGEAPRRRWPPEAPRAQDSASEPRPAAPASIWLSWAGTIVVIVLLVWGGYTFRTEVMHLWPASQRLYALMGIGQASGPAPR
ncbi:MAG: zinc-ribbon domain-containing protein [Acetobacteraceae bacterium]